MLKDEVLIWVLIIWVFITAIIALDAYARIEARAESKRITPVEEIKPIVKPVISEEKKEYIQPDVEIKVKETKTYFDVPLDEPLQDYIFALCNERNIDPAIVIAVIGKESVYNPDAKGDGGNSLGLMQIQPKWHKERFKRLGTKNLFDPYQNVTVGIDILDELIRTGKSIEWVLMAYNGGASYANEKLAVGMVSDYANTVLTNARLIETYEVVEEG